MSKDWFNNVQECREIATRISEYGVSEYQRLKLIEILALELEEQETMINIITAVKPTILRLEEITFPEKEKVKDEREKVRDQRSVA